MAAPSVSLPPGFKLDAEPATPTLPVGFTMDAAPAAPARRPNVFDGPSPSYLRGLSSALEQGATLGLADEAGAAGRATGSALRSLLNALAFPLTHDRATIDAALQPGSSAGTLGVDPGKIYDEALAEKRQDLHDFAADNPGSNFLATMVGGLSAVPSAGVTAAATPGRLALNSARAGAGLGAATGFGQSEGIENRLEGVAEGGALGGTIGAAAPYAMPYIERVLGLPYRVVKQLIAPFTKGGQEATAGRILSEAAGTPTPAIEAAPISGMKPTFGQASDNGGVKWLERSAQQGSPGAKALSVEAGTKNNQALVGAIKSLGDTDAAVTAPQRINEAVGTAADEIAAREAQRNTAAHATLSDLGNHAAAETAPARMASALDEARQAGRAAESEAWGALGNPKLPTAGLKQAVDQYVENLPKAYRPFVPKDILGALDGLGVGEGFDEFQALRSMLGSQARAAAVNNPNQARIIRDIQGLVDSHLEKLTLPPPGMQLVDRVEGEALPDKGVYFTTLDPAQLASYGAARAKSMEFNQAFKQPDIRKALGMDSAGFDRLPESATADQFIRSGRGAPEALDAYLKATQNNPAAAQAARDAFASKMRAAAATNKTDARGNPMLDAGKLRTFVDDYAHVLDSPLYTDAQRSAIRTLPGEIEAGGREAAAARQEIGFDKGGSAKYPASYAADQYIRAGKGAPEALNGYLKATKSTTGGWDAARDAFARKFLDSVSSVMPDAAGTQVVLAGKVTNFIKDFGHVIESPLFTNDQRALIRAIGKGADMANRTARAGAPGGSDTYAKLAGGRFVDAMIGTIPARALTTGAGAASGFLAGGPMGAVGGAALGGVSGQKLVDALYAAPREKIVALVDKALHDPDLAKALMMKAAPKGADMMPARVRGVIWSVLGRSSVGDAARERSTSQE